MRFLGLNGEGRFYLFLFLWACLHRRGSPDAGNIITLDNRPWIIINRQKTNVQSNIPLLEIPQMILDKYKGKTKDNRLLPVLSNQKINAYLKEIADLCGIKKRLSYHLARHSIYHYLLKMNVLKKDFI